MCVHTRVRVRVRVCPRVCVNINIRVCVRVCTQGGREKGFSCIAKALLPKLSRAPIRFKIVSEHARIF